MAAVPSRRPYAARRAALLLALGALAAAALAGTAADDPRPVFVEATGAGVDFVHFNGMSGELYFVEMAGGGGALADFDNDGDLDLYLVQGTMLGHGKTVADALMPPRHQPPFADRVYRNDLSVDTAGRRTLRFTDVTATAGDVDTGYSMGVTAGDYDNDGFVDLYVTNFGANKLLRNRGPRDDGTIAFEDVTDAARAHDARWSVAAIFFDYDRDGWLDLYVGNYVQFSLATHKACIIATGAKDYCGPNAYDPEPDRLLRNRGRQADGTVTFEDVTVEAGLGAAGAGLGAVAVDLDGNGWLDLYVANDGAANHLWLNQGAGQDGRVTFVDEALFAGAAVNGEGKPEASMGVDAGDFDGDGDDDLIIAHLALETNTLYVNDGRGRFRDGSMQSGLAAPSWRFTGFGAGWIDVDNDGWLDLLVVNGAVKVEEDQLRAGEVYPLEQSNQLFLNRGADGGRVRFDDVTARAGDAFALREVSRGAVFGDLDNDGDADAVLLNNSGPARVLINQIGQDRHWLGLRLVAGTPPRDQIGARVTLYPGGDRPPLVRSVRSDGSYASANDPRVLFGLGAASSVARVEVRWADGTVERFAPAAVDRYWTLRRGEGVEAAGGAPP